MSARARFLSARLLVPAIALTALPWLGGCLAPPPGVVYVRTAPPPPRTEYLAVAPGPDFVWIRGYYRWEGNDYVWVPGHYERRPRARSRWVAGHWRHSRHGWYWIDGHWR